MKLALTLALALGLNGAVYATQGYYRSPDIHGDTVVFTAEGDLWTSSLSQNQAKRLTSHVAEEKQASISNDGKWVAYAADYEGATEVYVISINGGVAKRVTFENSRVKVHHWTPDNHVLYSTNSRVGPTGNWTLRTVNPKTLSTQSIPLADAVEGVMAEDGKNLFFTQFGLQVSTDNAKVYRGGALGELWRYKLDSNKEATKLTNNHIGSARQPMTYKDKLIFISDASGNDNLWQMDQDGKNFKQLTHYKEWPIRAARLDNGRVIYQLGADLYLFDLNSLKSQIIDISLTSDFPNLREHWVNNPLKYLTSARLTGKQDKITITARGRVAIAGTDQSRLIEVNTPQNSRTRQAILSPDGKWVYAFNDASGEMEIWKFAADGSNQSKQLTKDGYIFRWNISLSPDGKWIAHDDKNGDLWLLNTETLKNQKILTHGPGLDPYADTVWSKDSQLLAITRTHQNEERSRVILYSLKEDKHQVLTSDKYNSYSPAFDAENNWLYFLSERYFSPSPSSPWGDRNMGTAFDRRAQIFAYALNNKAEFPFQPVTELSKKTPSDDKKDKKKAKKSDNKVNIDWKNIANRLWQVPVSSGNYSNLSVAENHIYVQDLVNEPDAKPELKVIKIKSSPEIKSYSDGVETYQLSHDRSKLFVKKQGGNNANMFIVSTGDSFPGDTTDMQVQATGWQLLISPKSEWQQIFHDAWLMHRDSLFDNKLRGVDWNKTKNRFQPLLDRLTDRHELNDIFKQMMGELNTLHSQVRGGDLPKAENSANAATLGATFNQTKKGVEIEHIYQYDPELPSQASPLLQPGVDAAIGDRIIAVNNIKTFSVRDLNRQLRNQAGKQVLLELKRGSKTVKTIVTPATTSQEYQYRYNDWVSNNRKKVSKASNDIGYLHIHAMGPNDIAEFAREFYANYDKPGLIIDVRRNRGGNIDSWILEKLLRKAWMFWKSPIGKGYSNMQQTFRGKLVVLADQFTYSDGETFTAGIKALNLAPVIGKQTAGAGVWLRDMNTTSDFGIARVAEFPQYALDGRWVVEGSGVKPTIEVDNLPHATFKGNDAQLNKAIEYLKQKMKNDPMQPLENKPFPKGISPAEDIILSE